MIPFCYKCKGTTELTSYGEKHYKDKTYKYYICRSCNTKRNAKYRYNAKGKVRTYRYFKKYKDANKDRVRAWGIASKIPRQPCEVCGEPNTHRHHPDPSKPLEIIFLCPLHHRQADLQLKKSMII